MAHFVGHGGAMPMLQTRRRPDHITWPYLPLVAIPFLHPTYARCDDQNLAGRMSVPGGSCARFKGDVAARRAHRRVRSKKRGQDNRAREILSRRFGGGPRAVRRDLHVLAINGRTSEETERNGSCDDLLHFRPSCHPWLIKPRFRLLRR